MCFFFRFIQFQDAFRLMLAARAFSSAAAHPSAPLVMSLAMGEKGQVSRVFNAVLTPVTHPSLPVPAAPGQLSAREVQTARLALGLTARRRFFLFGSPIALSPSPAFHNTGFEWCGLPFVYERFETKSVDDVKRTLAQRDFGGASVTIPLKVRFVSFDE